MKFFKHDESKPLMELILFSGIKWMKEIRERHKLRRLTIKNQRELLKLGPHLLKDLGFDTKGYLLSADSHENIGE